MPVCAGMDIIGGVGYRTTPPGDCFAHARNDDGEMAEGYRTFAAQAAHSTCGLSPVWMGAINSKLKIPNANKDEIRITE